MTQLTVELQNLKELLNEGEALFNEVLAVEEELQGYVIKGAHSAILDSQDRRDSLEARLKVFEKRGNQLIPDGQDIASYINERCEDKVREELLTLFYTVNGKLGQIHSMQGVNKSLLQERARFAKEIQKVLMPQKDLYDNRGQIQDEGGKDNLNINKTC